MIKITLGKTLNRGDGVCDFCGEQVNDGICGKEIERKAYFTCLKDTFNLEWFKKHFWSFESLYWASQNKDYQTKEETITLVPLICKNCIKQLAKQI
ncbi:MAG: hypothetical protein NT135_02125 [Candidatus Berkelbacteria bacterium]|nr:hypothetical protein [Candidatus Berkelbacteria bacterium]